MNSRSVAPLPCRVLLHCLAFAIVLPAVGIAQQIRGVVVEDSTSIPLSDARVELLAADGAVLATTVSSGTGWFSLTPQSEGEYVIRASHYAYQVTYEVAVAVGLQEVVTLVLRLSGGPIPIEPVIARARAYDRASGFRERASRAAFGRFITRADIDRNGAYSLSHLMRFTPEVRIERVRDGVFTSDGVFMRSFGDLCIPAIYLDGIAMPRGAAFDLDALLTMDQIEGIEVYRNSASAPMELRLPAFDMDMFCGVIAVWSRPTPGTPMTLKRAFFASSLVGLSLLVMRVLQ